MIMKHLKSYEGRELNKYERKVIYKHLNAIDSKKLEEHIEKFFLDNNIIGKISKLNLKDYTSNSLDYDSLWESDIISSGMYDEPTNIYRVCDDFCFNNCEVTGRSNTPAVRNTFFDISKKLYKKYNVEDKLNKQLIKLLEKDPLYYRSFYEAWEEELTSEVRLACQYMLDSVKNYNL